MESRVDGVSSSTSTCRADEEEGMQVACFSHVVDDVLLHFQIIRLHKQIYVWIGCNCAKLGHLYAAATTRPSNRVSVTSILGGTSDNSGSGIARRLVLKTGLNIVLACNIPKNSPMLEAAAEKKLIEKLIWILRSLSDAPPTHYMVKIQSFSSFPKNLVKRYDTGEFKAGGYKWKLVLYPSGNQSKNVKDHISLYLAMADTSSLALGWEVHAIFRLFLLDQERDNYLILQGMPNAMGKGRCFHGMNLEHGYDQFVPLKSFNDASRGYLVEDTCVFGAEVFVCQESASGKGECLSMIKEPVSFKHSWKIENLSKLDREFYDSTPFISGDKKWKIRLYPGGKGIGTGTHLSLFVALADPAALPQGTKICAECTLCIIDQIHAKRHSCKATFWFSASNQECGSARFISVGYFGRSNMGFLVKDACLVEAEVSVIGETNSLSQAFCSSHACAKES
ncbi:Proteasome assembly chaperone 4 [Dillenia turbinata]|uniref:Proteasome assembly chaperone 4 n=1 Tax=Dillenia turbinata TaxID=194707 RepID=A0AAN8YUX1_9MAGN